MENNVTEQVSKVLQRRLALDPYLQRLLVFLVRDAAEVSGSSVAVDGVDLPIDPWVISRLGLRVDEGRSELSEVLWNTLALLLKSGNDAARLREGAAPSPGADLYALQADLMLNIGLGTALLRESHQMIDDLVRQGSVPDARKFSRVHHRLRSVVLEMKQSIAKSNRDCADPLGGDLAEAAAPGFAMPGDGSGVSEEEQPPPLRHVRWSRDKRRAGLLASVRPPLRTKVLVVLAGSGFVVWTLSVLMAPLGGQTAKELSIADFVSSAPIVEIVARPPSLYVSIDEKVWSGYDEIRKRHLVVNMGSVLLTNGYWGLLLRSPQGKPLAEWSENRGARLLDGKKELTAPALKNRPTNFDRFVP